MLPLLEHAHHRHQVGSERITSAEPLLTCVAFAVRRTSDGKLHLLPEIGKIPFVDATLVEDPTESSSCDEDDGKRCVASRSTRSSVELFHE